MNSKELIHNIVSDVKRVSEEIGYTPSRDKYLEFGNFGKHIIIDTFGSYTNLISAAGLSQSKNNSNICKPYEKQKNQFDIQEDLKLKYESEIHPYIGKWENKRKETTTILVLSDLHDEYVNKFLLSVAYDVADRVKPDIIVFNGDVFDFPTVSKFNSDPRRIGDMQKNIDFGINNFFKKFREICPDSQIDFLLGNHELRLYKWLCQNPQIFSLRALQFNNLLELDEHRINLVARKTFLTEKISKATNYKIYNDALVAFHGSSCSPGHAATNLKKFGKSGFSGHVHNHQVHSMHDLNGDKFWVSLPTMADYDLADEYIEDMHNWSSGFYLFHIDNGRIIQEPIIENDGFCLYSGKYYYK